ncbi:hypothetical protein CLPU_1c02250 [Gottschalkia purinilytica]|uniref:Phage protein n=1 Tax=Gottschalkia purinilytica TaxID=1503 RepID=A0A0L0WF63_GOTPU|nr:hypothetical protein [Gottschalkia purinilytica]KNF10060.1 hypothetical protein CLPU_1c02250 [Gottschalkia purinilytica]
MLSFNDIRDSFILKLSERYPNTNIYDESIQQGFEEPAFFVQFIPISTTRESKTTKSRLITVDIQYFPKNVNDSEEIFKIADELENAFQGYIEVKDRKLKLENIKYKIVHDGIGNVLHFEITINYLETIPFEEKGETAKEVILKQTK